MKAGCVLARRENTPETAEDRPAKPASTSQAAPTDTAPGGQMSPRTVTPETHRDRSVTESAERAIDDAVTAMIAAARAQGITNDVLTVAVMRAVNQVQLDILRDTRAADRVVVGRVADVEVAIADGRTVVLGAVALTPLQTAELSKLLIVAGYRADMAATA